MAIGTLVIIASGVGLFAFSLHEDSTILMVLSFGLLAVVWLFASDLRAALRPNNWLLRFDGQRLLIRFRSYANWRLPAEDLVVVELEADEVVAIARTREKRRTPEARQAVRQRTRKLLDIETRVDLTELAEHLKTERSRRIQTRTGSYICRHYPVQVVDGHTVRVDFTAVKPGLTKTLARLGQTFRITSSREHLIDTVSPDIDMRAKEMQIIELIEQGQDLEAIRSVRKLYGCGLTEAKQFVEGLKN